MSQAKKPAKKPEPKHEAKPEPKHEAKPESQPVAKPEHRDTAKPERRDTAKPEPKRVGKHEPKADTKRERKPDHKHGEKKPPETSAAGRKGIRAAATAETASAYDDDQNTNIDHVLTVGLDLRAPKLALIAAMCLGRGENGFHTDGCNGYSGCGCARGCCGFFQIDCAKQAQHDYKDVRYWAEIAYRSGFYSHGGLISMANDHPDWTPGYIANLCQGAYSDYTAGGDYYNRYRAEAEDLVNSRVPGLQGGSGGSGDSGTSPINEVPPSHATSWLGPLRDINAAGLIDNAWGHVAAGASAARGGGKKLVEYVLSLQTIDPSG